MDGGAGGEFTVLDTQVALFQPPGPREGTMDYGIPDKGVACSEL